MALIEAAVGVALTWAAERVLDAGGDWVRARLADHAAENELILITERAVEAAISAAPELAGDLRSDSFLNNVIGPIAVARLSDPASDNDPDDLVDRYIVRFVEPWVRGGTVEQALDRLLQSDRSTLRTAMATFINSMRTGLFASDHWKDVGRDRTLEETHSGVLELIERQRAEDRIDGVSLDTARADALIGSRELLEWQRDTAGAKILRPELENLLERIRANPRGRTLVIGEAGAGKSALLSELTETLQAEGVVVFGLKADLIPPNVLNLADLSAHLGLNGDLAEELDVLARAGPVVLVIDQLDAVSDVMDRTSQRMRLLLNLAKRFQSDPRMEAGPPVHVVVSSRPFEAAHDARFQTLHAEEVRLTLPSPEAVDTLLREVGLDPAATPAGLKETIRRPFALRLFVELSRTGAAVGVVTPSDLLNAWLMAKLPDHAARTEAAGFLERLAAEMTDTETLWRPADVYDQRDGASVALCEAAGLLVRQGGRIGFSHQSWLDDFQAKGFATGADLVEFAWRRQDGLFVRGTVLRALERMRRVSPETYDIALDQLLGDARTRRHLRHLVVDIVAAQIAPRPREIAWVERLMRSDAPLARRAVGKLVDRWGAWRSGLRRVLPHMMETADLQWAATRLLQAEARLPDSETFSLLAQEWPDPEHDNLVFEVIWRTPLWSPAIRDRFEGLASRTSPADTFVAHYISNLVDAERPTDAIDLLMTFLHGRPRTDRARIRLYKLSALAAAAPIPLAQALTPWFVELTMPESDEAGWKGGYPQARSLPRDWEEEDDENSVFHLFKVALADTARTNPTAARELLAQLVAVEGEEAQILVAETYAAASAEFAADALTFLRADNRRFDLGEAHYDDGTGCTHSLHGYASQQLVGAISPHLDARDLAELQALIGRWTRYPDELWPEDDAASRRQRRQWADEARMELMARLPDRAFDVRGLRRIKEWRAGLGPRKFGRSGAFMVGSPMSTDQMAKAGDDDVMKILNECSDGTDWGDRGSRRHITTSGGAIQAGRAFGALAKTDPGRVVEIIKTRLTPDRHQLAAGNAVHSLSESNEVDAAVICELVRTLHDRGFESEDFRRYAAWSLDQAAHRLTGGLSAGDLAMLESWIVDDADQVETERTRRTNQAAARPMQVPSPDTSAPVAQAVLFTRNGGGIIPQGNYSYLSAIGAGLLSRERPDCQGWLGVLERHAERADASEVWAGTLLYYGRYLFWADRSRVAVLFDRLWAEHPEAFEVSVAGRLFPYRAMFPAAMEVAWMQAWLNSGDDRLAQAAGEYLGATLAVSGPENTLAGLISVLLEGPESPARTGLLFGSSAAWRQNAGRFRVRAHEVLRRFAPAATGDEAEAISTALDGERSLMPDERTSELLQLALDNSAILQAATSAWFGDALQDLLLQPGFDEIVLAVAEGATDLAIGADQRRYFDQDFVSIAIALQRSDGPLRARAMDLYERLLDAEVYGAAEAAAATLRD